MDGYLINEEVNIPLGPVAAVLLLVGSLDGPVINMNEEAYHYINATKDLKIIQGASHLFEEPGKLEEVAEQAKHWFLIHF